MKFLGNNNKVKIMYMKIVVLVNNLYFVLFITIQSIIYSDDWVGNCYAN